MNPRRLLPTLAVLAACSFLLWEATAPAAVIVPAESGAITLIDRPRQLVARPYGLLAAMVPRRDQGFLVGYSNWGVLEVGRFAEDGTREEIRRFGSLGYSDIGNLNGLTSLAPQSWAVAWDDDHHYAGFLGSTTVFLNGDQRHTRTSDTARAPTLVADGKGGAIGVYRENEKLWFGTWSARGKQLTAVRVPNGGHPTAAFPFRGGMLFGSYGEGSSWRIEWLDAQGRRVESGAGLGGALATDGAGVIAEAMTTRAGNLAVRLGSRPSTFGRPRLVATAEDYGIYSFDVTITPGGGAVVAWLPYPRQECGIWVRAIKPSGEPAGAALCAVERIDADNPVLATSAAGTIWLAWRTQDEYDPAGPPQIARLCRRTLLVE